MKTIILLVSMALIAGCPNGAVPTAIITEDSEGDTNIVCLRDGCPNGKRPTAIITEDDDGNMTVVCLRNCDTMCTALPLGNIQCVGE